MNKVNVQHAINIMERVKLANGKFDMTNWQTAPSHVGVISKTEAELHACGNSACFAGYVAISPEWKLAGGSVNIDGIPQLGAAYADYVGDYAEDAIASWLNLSEDDSQALCCCGGIAVEYTPSTTNLYGDERYADITIDHVLVVLRRLLATGSIWEKQNDGM